jgi:hypothetical protein
MAERSYSPAVQQLLTLGEVKRGLAWTDYAALGLKPEHGPELIQIATDEALNMADKEDAVVWAPLHAWRALAQLRVKEAIAPLIALLDLLEDDDWIHEDFGDLMMCFGPRAVQAAVNYLETFDPGEGVRAGITLVEGLVRIAQKYPETRGQTINALAESLDPLGEPDPEWIGWAIDGLVTLRAKKQLPLIANYFVDDLVDSMVIGWDDVVEGLGLPDDAVPEEYL